MSALVRFSSMQQYDFNRFCFYCVVFNIMVFCLKDRFEEEGNSQVRR